jgi:hypothetical protein
VAFDSGDVGGFMHTPVGQASRRRAIAPSSSTSPPGRIVHQIPVIGLLLAVLNMSAACTNLDSGEPGVNEPSAAPSVSASTPSVVPGLKSIDIGTQTGAIQYGLGGAWITVFTSTEGNSDVVKLDAKTRKPVLTIKGAYQVAMTEDSIWAVGADMGRHNVQKINPASGKPLLRATVPGAFYVSVGDDAVWVTATDGVAKVNPRTGKSKLIPIEMADVRPKSVVATSNAIWIADPSMGNVTRVDPKSDKVVATIHTGSAHFIAVDKSGVWVTNDHNYVSRIDPRTNRIVAKVPDAGSGYAIRACRGAIWASAKNVGVFRIDPATNKAQLAVPLEAETNHGLGCGENELWISGMPKTVVYTYTF